VKNNFQRLRWHRFGAVDMDALRIEIQATNGDPEARIFEIRCYARR
jgi:hypothetical protein